MNRLKNNLTDWFVYYLCVSLLTSPIFNYGTGTLHENMIWVGTSLIISFLFGMLNRIIRELTSIKEILQNKKNDTI